MRLAAPSPHYQLTHDYLVPAVRTWLRRRQTWQETCLDDCAALWKSRHDNIHLPKWWQYPSILWNVPRRDWTDAQCKMMRQARRYYASRVAMLLVSVAGLAWVGYDVYGRYQAASLVGNVVTAKEEEVAGLIRGLTPYRRWARPLLQQVVQLQATSDNERRQQIHARLALLPMDQGQVPDLLEELLNARLAHISVIRDALAPYAHVVQDLLWSELHEPPTSEASPERRFRAGLALASYAADSDQWTAEDGDFLVDQLLSANPEHQPELRHLLLPLHEKLLNKLITAFHDEAKSDYQIPAANALAEFAGNDKHLMSELLASANEAQYGLLYPLLDGVQDLGTLVTIAQQSPAEELDSLARVTFGKRRAGAAITLLRHGEWEKSLEALRIHDDPESLTQFVHGCRVRGATFDMLIKSLLATYNTRETKRGDERRLEDHVVFGLLLALGEYPLETIPPTTRAELIQQLTTWHQQDRSSAIHSATRWLLQHWGQKVEEREVPFEPDREWFTKKIDVRTKGGLFGLGARQQAFYLTFIVFPQGEYWIGSPPDEPDREPDERRHAVSIPRTFAILDREIRRAEMEASGFTLDGIEQYSPSPEHAMVGPSWGEAVMFCRWLGERAGLSEEQQVYGGDANAPDVQLERAGFRLPTESEWEAACRAGTRTMYGFGGDRNLLGAYAWFETNSEKSAHVAYQNRPNLRGIFGMHGNAFEWCQDWYGDDAAVDEGGPRTGSSRVIRGGSWGIPARHCRSACRNGNDPSNRRSSLGFRVALSPSSESRANGGSSGP